MVGSPLMKRGSCSQLKNSVNTVVQVKSTGIKKFLHTSVGFYHKLQLRGFFFLVNHASQEESGSKKRRKKRPAITAVQCADPGAVQGPYKFVCRLQINVPFQRIQLHFMVFLSRCSLLICQEKI